MKTIAIVLAAGMSTRMGANKLLLEIDGKTIIEHILDRLSHYETIVVTGHCPKKIEPILKQHGVKIVHNPDYELGMITSFQAGLKSLDKNVDAVFMVLSDTFGFNPSLLYEMEQKMESTKALLVSPVYKGKRGHPIMIFYKLFKEFLDMKINKTMKDLVMRYEDKHEYVLGDVWTKVDLDTPEDYERVKKLWANR